MHAGLVVLALTTLAPSAAPPAAPPTLDFVQLRPASQKDQALAPEVEALAGKTVRVVGHVVHMELAPRAAFYLAARPAEADESGGGTGDLPLDAVRVEVPWFPGEVPRFAGPVEVIGRLELGRREDDEGRVSWVRLFVEQPPAIDSPSPSPGAVTPNHLAEGGRP